jgi:hypothetical protein
VLHDVLELAADDEGHAAAGDVEESSLGLHNGLYVMAPDGSVRSSLQAPEPFTSYPSINAAGDIWIASAATLGLLR